MNQPNPIQTNQKEQIKVKIEIKQQKTKKTTNSIQTLKNFEIKEQNHSIKKQSTINLNFKS